MSRLLSGAAAAAAATSQPAVSIDEIEAAVRELFHTYDLDDSGEVSRSEFLKIEMRLMLDAGEFIAPEVTSAMTIADTSRTGALNLEEFRQRHFRICSEMACSREEVLEITKGMTERVLSERAKMGARYHKGIRQLLRRMFSLFDRSGDGVLAPDEWIVAQKVVAMEIGDDIDEEWIGEASFKAADTNNDGVLDEQEFLEVSFSMFDGSTRRTDACMVILERIVASLEEQRDADGDSEQRPVEVYVQANRNPLFRPPHASWQDEPTLEDIDRNADEWTMSGEVIIPSAIQRIEDVAAIVRLLLSLPPNNWLAIFFIGARADGPLRPISLMRGSRPGEGNVAKAVEYLSKPNAVNKIYVKNIRQSPSRLSLAPMCFFEERDAILACRTGSAWGLDWETQLLGVNVALPPRPLRVAIGDVVVIEVPQTDENGEYQYASSCYMENTEVLSKPVEENVVVKAKKKKKAAAAQPEADPALQLSFVAMQEGTCVLFVDLSWEDQEEVLVRNHGLTAPCIENTVGRIGPIEVEVSGSGRPSTSGGKDAAPPTFQWWNGEKWSNKKGPVKSKRKR